MSSLWTKIVGQDRTVERLRQLATTNVQSFLFVGPEGCGKELAARIFATTLITQSDNDDTREADLIMRGEFSDVNEIFRVGAAVDADEAEGVVLQSSTTPLEAKVKVIIIHEVHLMRDAAAVRLLKTIEEPAKQIIFILLADQIVPSLTRRHPGVRHQRLQQPLLGSPGQALCGRVFGRQNWPAWQRLQHALDRLDDGRSASHFDAWRRFHVSPRHQRYEQTRSPAPAV